MTVTAEEVKEIAEGAADAAITKMWLALGVDVEDPKAILQFQTNMRHLNAWREATDLVKRQSLKTAVGVIITGVLGLIWLALQRH